MHFVLYIIVTVSLIRASRSVLLLEVENIPKNPAKNNSLSIDLYM